MVDEMKFIGFKDHQRIRLYTLYGRNGMTAQVTNYGAKLISLNVPNKDGEIADVVLGFSSLDEWMAKETYFNATIGRYANRIKDGRFILNGVEYQLPQNNIGNCLHGGIHGFNEQVWEVVAQSRFAVTMHYRAKDGEEGFPGNLDAYVSYSVTKDGGISITFEAKTDKPTIVSFTNHAYFNLEGEGAGNVYNHVLQVNADQYTPFDDTFCPTGEILPVEGTPMDFRQRVRIGDRIDDKFFERGHGIDNNFVLNRPESTDNESQTLAAIMEAGGRRMEVQTTFPGLQVYTGNWIEKNIGKSGRTYDERHAICLETQNFPDSPNHDNFPSAVLRPGEMYYQKTTYRFS